MKVKNTTNTAQEELKRDADIPATTVSGKGEVKNTEEVIGDKQDADIPAYADKLLKLYSNYAELAIDAKGGVYVGGTKHPTDNNPILYQNPYYKS